MIAKLIKKRLRSYIFTIPSYLQLQLFLMLMSWPILLMHGIPLSAGVILGNLMFAPLLTPFLTIASLIFFLELCLIPSTPLIFLLELLTQCWCWLLDFSHRSWLYHFPRPSILMLLLIPLTALTLLHLRKIKPLHSTVALIFLFISAGLLLKLGYRDQKESWRMPCFEKEILLLQNKKEVALVDEAGALGRRISAPSYVSLTLIPTLIKEGIPEITAIIVPKISLTLLKSLAVLIAHFPVRSLYLPQWESSTFTNRSWGAWELLLRTIKEAGTKIVLVTTPSTLALGSKIITLTPHEKSVTKNGVSYKQFAIDTTAFYKDT